MAFIQDGFRTVIRIAGFPGIMLRSREVQPPQLAGGAPIETYTMHDVRVMTYEPQHLIEIGDITAQCNYDPSVYATILTSILNVKLSYTVVFPDNATITLYAFMYEFTPASLRKGEFPLAEVKIKPGNRNGVGAETTPTVVAGVGAGTLVWPPAPRPVGG